MLQMLLVATFPLPPVSSFFWHSFGSVLVAYIYCASIRLLCRANQTAAAVLKLGFPAGTPRVRLLDPVRNAAHSQHGHCRLADKYSAIWFKELLPQCCLKKQCKITATKEIQVARFYYQSQQADAVG